MKRSPMPPRTQPLERTPLQRTTRPKPGRGFAASEAQRQKVHAHAVCVVCGRDAFEVRIDPAHVIPRSLGAGDGALEVIPLCRADHRAYDEQALDLSPYLEPRYREEVAQAVRTLGLFGALEKITNRRWAPETNERNE